MTQVRKKIGRKTKAEESSIAHDRPTDRICFNYRRTYSSPPILSSGAPLSNAGFFSYPEKREKKKEDLRLCPRGMDAREEKKEAFIRGCCENRA